MIQAKYQKILLIYRNAKLERQLEFVEYIFYIECRDEVTESVYNKFLQQCIDEILTDLSKDKFMDLKIQYVLYDNRDINKFQEALVAYMEYLNILLN